MAGLARLLFAQCATRLLENRRGSLPGHTQVNGHPGSGKSYGADLVLLKMHPAECVLEKDSGSMKSLVHDDEPVKHRVLYYTQSNARREHARQGLRRGAGGRVVLLDVVAEGRGDV